MSAQPRVAVVTGASSGIGRAAASAFAAKGWDVVLTARSEGSLAEAVDECKAEGGRAVAVTADIAVQDDVDGILEAAIDAFGHVDVWVSAAATMAYGRFEDVPSEVHEHVVQTNLMGTMRCARVAIRHFRVRGRGVLINVGSLYGKMTSPYVSAYVTSKYGLVGFNEVLRQELSDAPGIATCLVLPSSIDTPIFRHTANYTGRGVRPVPPVSKPARVVRAIMRCAERPRRQVVVGNLGRGLAWSHALLPWLYDRLAPRAMEVVGLRDEAAPDTVGNVFEPMPEWNRVEGDWRRVPLPWTLAAAASFAALGGAAALRRGRPR